MGKIRYITNLPRVGEAIHAHKQVFSALRGPLKHAKFGDGRQRRRFAGVISVFHVCSDAVIHAPAVCSIHCQLVAVPLGRRHHSRHVHLSAAGVKLPGKEGAVWCWRWRFHARQ